MTRSAAQSANVANQVRTRGQVAGSDPALSLSRVWLTSLRRSRDIRRTLGASTVEAEDDGRRHGENLTAPRERSETVSVAAPCGREKFRCAMQTLHRRLDPLRPTIRPPASVLDYQTKAL